MFKFLNSRKAHNSLSINDAIRQSQNGELVVVDIREHAEVSKTGKAKGALHIPLTLLNFQADPRHPDFHPALDPAKPVALYCATGARSFMASKMLRRLGYTEVHNLGGLSAWVNAGGAVSG